jgi:hypothetical protein
MEPQRAAANAHHFLLSLLHEASVWGGGLSQVPWRVDYLFLTGENIKVTTYGDVPTNVLPMAGLLVEI